MKGFLNRFKHLKIFILTLLLFANSAWAENSQDFIRLSGHIPTKAITKSTFLKKMDPEKPVSITFVLPLRNQKALEELIQRLYDPQDPNYYGKYLTTEEFVEQFGPSEEDYNKVIAYAKEAGLAIARKQPNRLLLNVKGTTKSIEEAFKLNLYQYQQANGRKFYAPDNNPEVPLAIASIIDGVVGLDDVAVWKPLHRRHERAELPQAEAQASPSGPGGGFSPQDLMIAYNLNGLNVDGTGQTIALFQLAEYQVSDINTYTNHFGLPPAKLKNILVDGGSKDGINAEVTLDIELALSLAPASRIYVYEGPNTGQGVLNTYNRIATDNIAKQISISWGLGEDFLSSQALQAENAIFMQMATQGQSVYAAAGDSGAYDNYTVNYSRKLAVDDPASQPYVTGVGGTKLIVNSSTGAYESESVWDNGLGNGAGGGGVSKVWSIPSWQRKVSTVYSKTNRNVPDISLNSDPTTGYAIYHNGQWEIFGGTSCAAPLWASFNALVNQELKNTQQPVLGFVNPLLYAIGTSNQRTVAFNDITVGDNLYYPSKVGYDNASGWGTFNGANLFASLTNITSNPPTPLKAPLLNISMTHIGDFRRGSTGTYYIDVSNQGDGYTSNPAKVEVTLPSGLRYKSYSAPGWTFDRKSLTFTNNGVLEPNKSYSRIILNVSVSYFSASSVTPSATVSGGGSDGSASDSDLTTITW